MRKSLYIFIPLAIVLFGCEKFLDEKTNKKLVVPNSLRDVQALLDAYSNLNISDPGEGEVAADDYYLEENTWAALRNEEDRRAYVWEPDYSTTYQRWWTTYRNVYYANTVLENLEAIGRNPMEGRQWDDIKGQALFLRAKSFLSAVTVWSLAYDEATSETDLGVPLRLDSDYNMASRRASVEDTYAQIIADLREAIDLLPPRPEILFRGSRPAAMALLARAYLFMRDYDNCLYFADACLQIKDDLLDYNDLNPSISYPMPDYVQDNVEILYISALASGHLPLAVSRALVDTNLYHAYGTNDLRKMLFFQERGIGTYSFKGSYLKSGTLFSGLATDEVYLMRAECLARLGNIEAAMDDLNKLLSHRYVNAAYSPLETDNGDDALQYILQERRKELLLRGLRFPDVKRLNKEGAGISFRRILGGVEYKLPANDLKFALSIPEEVIELAPEITQNLR